MRSKLLTFGGLLLIAAALLFGAHNILEEQQAAKAAESVLREVDIPTPTTDAIEQPQPVVPAQALNPEMPTAVVDGHLYIGVLEIPDLGLSLPVMSQWSYPNLKLSPCRYTGSAYTDDLVIAAHNYARHFGNLRSLSKGSAVYLTDMDGNLFAYEVAEFEVLAPDAIEEMTAGEYSLTLFTCTYGGQSRIAVRCHRAAE